jgi:hypothetical protein
VWFDIDGDGAPEQVAWTEPDSDVSFLAIDLDGDGKISSGKELLVITPSPAHQMASFALLQMTMGNGGTSLASVSSDDPIFARLLLWNDKNHNGISEQWELSRAGDVLAAVGLGYAGHRRQRQERECVSVPRMGTSTHGPHPHIRHEFA